MEEKYMVTKAKGLPTAASWWKERRKIVKIVPTKLKKPGKARPKKVARAKPKKVKAKPKKVARAKPKKVKAKPKKAKSRKAVKSKKSRR